MKEFAEEIKNTKLEEGECITSYDVSALFTSIPVASAIDILKNRLEQDTELPKITIMSDKNIIELLGFCLLSTYFLMQGQFFEQSEKPLHRGDHNLSATEVGFQWPKEVV